MPLNTIKNIIAVGSGKGGVGKSTLSVHLAMALSEQKFKVGLMDADIYGPTQPGLLGSKERPVASSGKLLPVKVGDLSYISMGTLLDQEGPVVWRAPMAVRVVQQFLHQVDWGELDFLIVDLPPGTGDIQITLAQQANLSGAVIVSTPQNVALQVAKKGLEMFRQVNVPILGLVENMSGHVCSHCNQLDPIFTQGGAEKMANELKVPFLGAIPLHKTIVECSDSGKNIFKELSQEDPLITGYHDLVKNLLSSLESEKEFLKEIVPKEVSINNRGNLLLKWIDKTDGELSAHYLRSLCPCAQCVDETSGVRKIKPEDVDMDIKLIEQKPVGLYALSLRFSDNHSTGLFKYENLKEMIQNLNGESFSV